MRLSNVQYYFKSRDDVLAAMVGQYFRECTASLVRLTEESNAATARERLHYLVQAGLSHGQHVSDMCRAFREIWAISSRNELIDGCLMDYYRNFSELVADFAFPEGIDDGARRRLMTLLVPFFEGYSITARAMPMNMQDTATMLTDMAMSVVENRTA